MATYNLPSTVAVESHQRSLGDLFSDLTRDTATLIRQEVSLATTEITHKATRAGKDIGVILAGGSLAYAGIIVLLFGIATGLIAMGMAAWLAYLLVGGIVAGVGGFLAMQALDKLKEIDLVPHDTVNTLRDDVRWAKEQVKS